MIRLAIMVAGTDRLCHQDCYNLYFWTCRTLCKCAITQNKNRIVRAGKFGGLQLWEEGKQGDSPATWDSIRGHCAGRQIGRRDCCCWCRQIKLLVINIIINRLSAVDIIIIITPHVILNDFTLTFNHSLSSPRQACFYCVPVHEKETLKFCQWSLRRWIRGSLASTK